MPPFQLTPAQLALQAERKALKEAKKAAVKAQAGNGAVGVEGPGSEQDDKSRFLRREWVRCGSDSASASASESGSGSRRTTRIVTWNILAQTLVRRELFPGSDCLRWANRKSMLLAELGSYSAADIICLQECDRLSDLAKALPSHTPIDTKGRGKVHGLVVLYRTDRYKLKARHTVYLDEEKIQDKAGREGRGGSRQTKNVGLIVGLEDQDGKGIIVCTTHLFWHPKFAYERVRQSILLVRAIRRFQRENGCEDWPAVLAGDLNTQPSEATYQLLVSPETPLHPRTIDEINISRIVHTSVDSVEKIIPHSSSGDKAADTAGDDSEAKEDHEDEDDDGEGEGEGELPDHDERSIANTRPPKTVDGIIELDELVRLMCEVMPGGARSALGSMSSPAPASSEETEETFGTRGGLDGLNEAEGRDEPAYTCFTPLFKLTLDYIFILPALESRNVTSRPEEPVPERVTVVEHLRQARISELGNGLPRKGICASDHLAVGCGIVW